MRVATEGTLVWTSLVEFAEQVSKHLDWYEVGLDEEGTLAKNIAASVKMLKERLGERGLV